MKKKTVVNGIQIVLFLLALAAIAFGVYFAVRRADLPHDDVGALAHVHDEMIAMLLWFVGGVTVVVDGVLAIGRAVVARKRNR